MDPPQISMVLVCYTVCRFLFARMKMMKAAALLLACSPQGFESKTSHVFPRQEFGKMENMGGMMEGGIV